MNRPGLLGTFAALAICLAPDQQEVLTQEKGGGDIEHVQKEKAAELRAILDRLNALEKRVLELESKLTIEDLQEATRIAAHATVQIRLKRPGEKDSIGSGFFVDIPPEERGKKYDDSRAYIASAAHVVNKSRLPRLKNVSQQTGAGIGKDRILTDSMRLENEDAQDDLVVLSVDKKNLPADIQGLRLHNFTNKTLPTAPGHPAIVAGYPGEKFSGRPVFLSNMKAEYDIETIDGILRGTFFEFPATGLQGTSGGPLVWLQIGYKDKKRTLDVTSIGVIEAMHTVRSMGIAQSTGKLRKLCDACEITIAPGAPKKAK